MPLKQMVYSLPPLLTAALLAALAAVTLMRGRRASAGPLFAMLCLTGSLLYIDMLINFNVRTERAAFITSRIGHLFYPFLMPLFIHFFHAYLKIRTRRWLVGCAYGYAVMLAIFTANGWIISGTRRFEFGFFGQGGPLFFLMAAGAVFAAAYNGVIIYGAIVREEHSIEKNKLKYVFIGFGMLGLLTSMNSLTIMGVSIYPPGAFGFIPLLVFAFGIFRYDLLDMGVLIRKSLLYSVLTAVLAAVYLFIIVIVQRAFHSFRLTDSFLVPWVIIVAIVFGFDPLKAFVQSTIERIFAKGHHDYGRMLKRVSRTIATVMDKETITRLLQETLIDAMRVKNCTLFLIDPTEQYYHPIAAAGPAVAAVQNGALSADAPLVGFVRDSTQPVMKQHLLDMDGEGAFNQVLMELNRFSGEIILPMRFKKQLKGFLILGEKRSREIYSSEDMDLLEPLCHQSAVAIQNALAYQALNELNRTLEAKVMARTKDLRTALKEKERSQEQLIRSESLAALGQLVAGVAHELNNPLASVTSLLQATVEDLLQWDTCQPIDEDLIDDLNFADKELARAKSIVSSLLGLARQTQTYEEAVDINILVHDTLRVLHNQYKHTALNIDEALCDNLPKLQGNFANLGQVMLNIIQNAIQATVGKAGRIVLTTRYEAEPGQVVFSCQDNGAGIDAALYQDVFKPFFTTKPVGEGTGLGLYICHQIVQKHNGVIELAAAEPYGTMVTVRLPVGDRDSQRTSS